MMQKIFVAYHRPWKIFQDEIYQPIFVGAEGSKEQLSIPTDNTGENISARNPDYCELTLQYWMWKNLDLQKDDIVGLCHYRRYFDVRLNPLKRFVQRVILRRDPYTVKLDQFSLKRLEKANFPKVLGKYDIVLAKIVCRKTTLDVDTEFYDLEHLAYMREAIAIKSPQYLEVYDRVMAGCQCAPFNMFVARAEFLDNYSEWLFDVLFQAEELISQSGLRYAPRLYGYFSEQLLYVYALVHKMKIKHAPVIRLI